ncbi:MAG: hypothetical protein IIW34_05275, partial [Clostridia bacterium]|nr:hypothetical protein [Clostridia bacterium]
MDRKIKLRILSFACSATLCMTLAALSPVRAKSISSAALPMISVTANTGETLQFSAEDFYPSREKLSGIIITSLPEPSPPWLPLSEPSSFPELLSPEP